LPINVDFWGYSWSVLAFTFGALAGYQGIYDVYGPDSNRALRAFPGVLYLLTRGGLPALVFIALYQYGVIKQFPWLQAAACGAGWEIFLRSRIYVRQVRSGGGMEELFRGPFDLLRWYQNLFLTGIDNRLAKEKIAFVANALPAGVDFPALVDQVLGRLDAWSNREITAKLQKVIAKLTTEFERELAEKHTPEKTDQKYRYQLCYALTNELGRDGTQTILKIDSPAKDPRP
jgi:hypothetical protein